MSKMKRVNLVAKLLVRLKSNGRASKDESSLEDLPPKYLSKRPMEGLGN